MKNLQKIFIVLAFMGLSASAVNAQSGICGANGDNLTWTLIEGTLTISGTGAMADYEAGASPWYQLPVTNVIIENTVTTIGSSILCGCSDLISVNIPNSVISIGWGAFADCSGLTSVTIPNSVTTIGEWAFADCSGLTEVTIPNSVTTIGESVFYGCSGLTEVTIPNSVTTIGEWAFADCSGLTNIDVDANNSNYSSVNGVLFNKAQNTLIQYPAGKTGSYTIPNSVTSIGNSAFYYCRGLTSVTIPNSVTTIGEWAFYYCSGLTEVTIPNSVTTIGVWAFADCSGLTSVTIPNSVTTIGEWAFYYCSGLTELYVKAQTPPALGDYVFSGVSAAIPVHVPCGKAGAYQSATGWSDFSNYIDDIPFTVTVQSNNAAMGVANITQSNTSCTDNTAVIAATANQGYVFENWTSNGTVISTDNPFTFTVTQDTSIVANFREALGIIETGSPNNSVKIYPNPVKDVLFISSENRINSVEIADLAGRTAGTNNYLSAQQGAAAINISHLPEGVYLVKIYTDKGVAAHKIIIN